MVDEKNLYKLIDNFKKGAYPGGAEYSLDLLTKGWWGYKTENEGFTFTDNFVAGESTSMGQEFLTRNIDGKILWGDLYGGRIVEEKESLSGEILSFLKKALGKSEEGFQSFRGPSYLEEGDWEYTYEQKGNFQNFTGHEEIHFKGELVFYHDILGGLLEG